MEISIGAFRFPGYIPLDFGSAKVPTPVDGLTFAPGHPGATRKLYGDKEASATRLSIKPPPTRNKGRHTIHCGSMYDSRLTFFEVPP